VALNGLARAEEIEMLSILRARLRALLRKSEMERELDEELRHHIEQQTEQNIRLGMSPEEGLARPSAEWSKRRSGAATLVALDGLKTFGKTFASALECYTTSPVLR
jgi:hypothetical protein